MLLAARGGVCGAERRGRELVHLRDVGLATGGADDSRRGPARALRSAGSTSGRWLLHPIKTLWRRLLRHGLFQPETRIGRLTAELHTPFDAFERPAPPWRAGT